ncbi:hypothetical protein BDW74DRAFT_180834 [Aspergillus multicolor]|uniref:uncharacterized protein n=1 Tax=Aspergillus multicolor TaxID=41759 RepID=UPI003CCDEEAF
MASLLLIGAIFIAIKCVDEHEKKKKTQHQLHDIGSLPTETTETTTDTDSETSSVENHPSPKKNILSRSYWHERRRSREEAQQQAERLSLSLRVDAPPPYERTGTLPIYRELEKVDYQ